MGNPRARAMKGPRLSQTTTVASDKALFGGSFFLFLSRAQCGRVQWLASPPCTESAVFRTLSGEWMRSIVQEREAKESERTSNQQPLIFKQAAVIVSFRWFRFVSRSPLLEPPPPPPQQQQQKTSRRRIYTLLRSPHVNKDAREQFETRTHSRLIDIKSPSADTVDKLMLLDLPAGVDVEVKL